MDVRENKMEIGTERRTWEGVGCMSHSGQDRSKKGLQNLQTYWMQE